METLGLVLGVIGSLCSIYGAYRIISDMTAEGRSEKVRRELGVFVGVLLVALIGFAIWGVSSSDEGIDPTPALPAGPSHAVVVWGQDIDLRLTSRVRGLDESGKRIEVGYDISKRALWASGVNSDTGSIPMSLTNDIDVVFALPRGKQGFLGTISVEAESVSVPFAELNYDECKAMFDSRQQRDSWDVREGESYVLKTIDGKLCQLIINEIKKDADVVKARVSFRLWRPI